MHTNDEIALAQILISIIGFLFIGFQIRGDKNIARVQFINDLSGELNEYERLFNLLTRRGQDTKEGVSLDLKEPDILQVLSIITFFEKISLLVRDSFLKMDEVDLLFRRRFFILVDDEQVQAKVIGNPTYATYLQLFLELERTWRKHLARKRISP